MGRVVVCRHQSKKPKSTIKGMSTKKRLNLETGVLGQDPNEEVTKVLSRKNKLEKSGKNIEGKRCGRKEGQEGPVRQLRETQYGWGGGGGWKGVTARDDQTNSVGGGETACGEAGAEKVDTESKVAFENPRMSGPERVGTLSDARFWAQVAGLMC